MIIEITVSFSCHDDSASFEWNIKLEEKGKKGNAYLSIHNGVHTLNVRIVFKKYQVFHIWYVYVDSYCNPNDRRVCSGMIVSPSNGKHLLLMMLRIKIKAIPTMKKTKKLKCRKSYRFFSIIVFNDFLCN